MRVSKDIDGPIEFSIGKNAQENFDIIDEAEPRDIWFHVEGESSCHVIAHVSSYILCKKRTSKIIKQGAVLCKQHSRYASSKNLPIIYTFIENVTKTRIPGSVTTENTKRVVI